MRISAESREILFHNETYLSKSLIPDRGCIGWYFYTGKSIHPVGNAPPVGNCPPGGNPVGREPGGKPVRVGMEGRLEDVLTVGVEVACVCPEGPVV